MLNPTLYFIYSTETNKEKDNFLSCLPLACGNVSAAHSRLSPCISATLFLCDRELSIWNKTVL